METKLFYRLLIHDKHGRLIKRTRLRRVHSFVIAYLQCIQYMSQHAYGVNSVIMVDIKDTGGVISGFRAWSTLYTNKCFSIDAPDNEGNYGIVVGTGITPPTNGDYALASKIAHGVGVGELDYGAHNFTNAGVVGSNVDFVISRSFYNGSGATITVKEIGIIVATIDTNSVERHLLILRDITTPMDVLDTQTLTVQYTIRTIV